MSGWSRDGSSGLADAAHSMMLLTSSEKKPLGFHSWSFGRVVGNSGFSKFVVKLEDVSWIAGAVGGTPLWGQSIAHCFHGFGKVYSVVKYSMIITMLLSLMTYNSGKG